VSEGKGSHGHLINLGLWVVKDAQMCIALACACVSVCVSMPLSVSRMTPIRAVGPSTGEKSKMKWGSHGKVGDMSNIPFSMKYHDFVR
jgi:hypothetical protein